MTDTAQVSADRPAERRPDLVDPELADRARSFAYDLFGRLGTSTSGRGITTTYGYDKLDRVTSVSYSDATPPVSYTYDSAGKLHTRTDTTGTTTWEHDPKHPRPGRPVQGHLHRRRRRRPVRQPGMTPRHTVSGIYETVVGRHRPGGFHVSPGTDGGAGRAFQQSGRDRAPLVRRG